MFRCFVICNVTLLYYKKNNDSNTKKRCGVAKMMSFSAGDMFNLPVCVSTSRPPSERSMRMLERAARLPAVTGVGCIWSPGPRRSASSSKGSHGLWLHVVFLPSALFFSRLFLTYMRSFHYPSSEGGCLYTCTFPCRCFSRENSWSNVEVVLPCPGLLPQQKILTSFLIRGGNRQYGLKVFANAFLQWVISYRVSSNKDKPEVWKADFFFPNKTHFRVMFCWVWVKHGPRCAKSEMKWLKWKPPLLAKPMAPVWGAALLHNGSQRSRTADLL